MNKTIVEVGANWGHDTENFAKDPGNEVWAFEPTPNLFDHLSIKFEDNKNVHLFQKAVDIEETIKTFYIAGQGDWGCSSLYEFADNIHDTWPGRPDFNTTTKIEVETIRLDTFIKQNSIKSIDYLWIDAQGNDFKVLKSLGDKISIVSEGKCEGAYKVDLYKTLENRVQDIVPWLEERGFECTIVPDYIHSEADVHFKRKPGAK